MDNVLLLKFNDSVEWDRILLRPTESSLTLKGQMGKQKGKSFRHMTLYQEHIDFAPALSDQSIRTEIFMD